MKKFVTTFVAIILIIGAILFFSYPFINNYMSTKQTDSAVRNYLDISTRLEKGEYEKKLKLAKKYNSTLVGNVTVGDPFSVDSQEITEYKKLLELDGTDAIATISIPQIEVDLPVYYGTGTEELAKGVGLLTSSSLPVGGKGTHAVLTGHTGLSGLKLFSDLDTLKKGDVFFVESLGNKLAYKVDNIAVVLPEETELLEIDPKKDYVTLVTCTPYGINTHRLLVRGTRIPLEDGEKLAENQEPRESTWLNQYKKALIIGGIAMGVIVIVWLIIYLCRKRKKNEKHCS